MQFASWDPEQRTFDAGPYVEWLTNHAAELPPGARAFATHPTHYDYYAYRTRDEDLPPGSPLCTKDLLLADVSVSDHDGPRVELRLAFPGFDPLLVGYDLVLAYDAVTELSISARLDGPHREGMRMSHLLIDEVAPTPTGICHELGFATGAVKVCAADLRATWR